MKLTAIQHLPLRVIFYRFSTIATYKSVQFRSFISPPIAPPSSYSTHTTVDQVTASVNDLDRRVPCTTAEFYQKFILQQPKSPPDARLLKVAVLGCPNAGKSSLVNMLTSWQVCAVASKSHTTRSKQMTSLVRDNVQVVFVDLPGIIHPSKARRFNLSKAFIRDPHAAIHDSDMIIVVVDVSHRVSRSQLDPEVLKALHFFNDKQSILVLNKVDLSKNNPTRLLEVTRRLTGGIVGNKRSHLDAYEARFKKRTALAGRSRRFLPPSELVAACLPRACHEQAALLMQQLDEYRRQLSEPPPNSSLLILGNKEVVEEEVVSHEEVVSLGDLPGDQSHSDLLHQGREITQAETESIEAFFDQPLSILDDNTADNVTFDSVADTVEESNATPSNVDAFFDQSSITPDDDAVDNIASYSVDADDQNAASTNFGDDNLPQDNQLTTTSSNTTSAGDLLDGGGAVTDPLLDLLKEQLNLKLASPAEVQARREKWFQVSRSTQGLREWTGFDEVFMVSSASGDGIDRLREYLIEQARPNRAWLMSPLLVTDQEPSELIRMTVWAQCLDQLEGELPYAVRILVDDCERTNLDEGDDRVWVHARIQCKTERQLLNLLGPQGSKIKSIAAAVKLELMNMFRSNTVVKLTGEMASVRPSVMRRLRRTDDFAKVFPDYDSKSVPSLSTTSSE